MNKKEENFEVQGAIEIIDLQEYARLDKKPPIGKSYEVKIDEEKYVFDHHIVLGRELLEKAHKRPPECHTLYQKLKHCDFRKIGLNDKIDLTEHGIEHFVVKEAEVFNYEVNAEPETTDRKVLNPTEIMKLAGIPTEKQYLVQIHPDGTETSYAYEPNIEIKMLCTGMKFVTREWLEVVDI